MNTKTKTKSAKTTAVVPKRSATATMQRATTTAIKTTKKAFSSLSKRVGGLPGARQVKKHPVGVAVGAFAAGVAITKLVSRT